MKPRKNLILAMLLGLLLAASAAGIAQTPAQGDQKEKTHACSMDTCCCKDGSCPMKEDGMAKTEAKDCSCCTGDSCEMKVKDGAKKDSCCNMKHKNEKGKAKQKTA